MKLKDILWIVAFMPTFLVLREDPDDVTLNIFGALYGMLYMLYIHHRARPKRTAMP